LFLSQQRFPNNTFAKTGDEVGQLSTVSRRS
jgi:hypothetical protein